MNWFLLGIALLVAFLLAVKWLTNADPARIVTVLRRTGAVLAGLLALFFAVTGKLALAAPVAVLALMFLGLPVRWPFGGLGLPGMGARPTPGSASEMRTGYLVMTLDHDTGVLEGTVLQGRFRDRRLSELTQDQLIDLLGECRAVDREAAVLLETFLDRTGAADWREKAEARFGTAHGGEADSGSWDHGILGEDEAFKILGLEPGASAEDIKAAHKHLMKVMHPDHGGSGYVAAKINQAKDILLAKFE